jgi:Kef-type K+ transport system membrane component KefB
MQDFFEHLIQEFERPLANPILVFSTILLIILLAPILLRRLNIPGIIGLIISGVIIGPHGFNVLERNSGIQLFSTIGLLYIMFIAGLELDMKEFKVHKNKSLVFGFLTFIIPIAVGFPVCYYFLQYDINASLLTASMFATHTLVSYPIVNRYGISKSPVVAIAVGGTILTDTAVLIILAVIIKKSQGELTYEFWGQLIISLLIFAAIMFYLVPRVAKWFFRKLENEKHAHYIFVLSVLFFSAFLAEVAGVEPIIGAFVAGLTLNKIIPHSSALMNRIEFMGNALFIPFFLISVGMIVDVKVIFNGYGPLIVAATLTIVALIGKWLAALFTQWIFNYNKAQRQLIFGLSSSHAAATLAIILVGFNDGILDENILNGTIILILITCIVASFATEKAAKKMVLAGDHDHTQTSPQNISEAEHILVSKSNLVNLEKHMELAVLLKDKKSPNPISLLSVVPDDVSAESNIRRSKRALQSYVNQGSATETPINVIATIDFNERSGISRISREIMADIIMIDWPEKGDIVDKLIGDKTDQILTNADKSIFVIDINKPLVGTKKIMVIAPPLCENESGFETWVNKIIMLTSELSVNTVVYANEKTHTAITKFIKQKTKTTDLSYYIFDDWNDVLVLSKYIDREDLLIFISSRKGFVSYQSVMDTLLPKIDKYFDENNKVIIYPKQHETSLDNETFEDINSGPLSKGLETIGKGIETIFKLGKD